MKINHVYDPWHHLQVEDFLPPDEFDEIKRLALIEYDTFRNEGVNCIYNDVDSWKRKKYANRSKYVRFLSEDILPSTNQFFRMLPEHRGFSGDLKKVIHWSIQPENHIYPNHIDNAPRINTCTFYIWPEENVGTILCDNPSKNDDGDHSESDQESKREVEVEWKPNKLFVHNSIPNKTWHRYQCVNPRIVLSLFLVQPDLIRKGRIDINYLIDVDSKYYEDIL